MVSSDLLEIIKNTFIDIGIDTIPPFPTQITPSKIYEHCVSLLTNNDIKLEEFVYHCMDYSSVEEAIIGINIECAELDDVFDSNVVLVKTTLESSFQFNSKSLLDKAFNNLLSDFSIKYIDIDSNGQIDVYLSNDLILSFPTFESWFNQLCQCV